ncbi:MAG: cytochrome c [Bacteroidia bacterium]|nr:cytochrome c [Bacteroidia bacterium]
MIPNLLIKTMIFCLVIFVGTGCYYDNEEDLYPVGNNTCDTTGVSYVATVVPVLQNNCYVCHDAATKSGNIALDTYDGLKRIVDNGKFWGSINHESGFAAMPQNGNKLSDCTLSKIKAWINTGAPND